MSIDKQIKTKKGSIIKRYKNVGKKMGNDLYFHKIYVSEYINDKIYYKFKSYLPDNFEFNILKFNDKNNTISFINSPDFDISDEPIVSDSYKVSQDGKVKLTKEKSIPQIYHHKWLFVKDDYSGFNVPKSKERSERWLEVSDKINMSKIGFKGYWVKEVLPLLESLWKIPKQEFTSAKTSIRQIPKPAKTLITNNVLKPNTINLDIGGGKYDEMTNYFNEHGIKNYVYDPFNKSEEHNKMVIKKTENGQCDSVTIFNVLNVIKEEHIQLLILKQALNAIKDSGNVYIYSNYYIKGKTAREIKNRDSYQHNYKLSDVLHIVRKVFPDAIIDSKFKYIIANK